MAEIPAGDIGAVAKLAHTSTGDTLTTKGDDVHLPQFDVPEPLLDVGAIRAMQAEGIEFQSHTTTHPRLTQLSPGVAREELCSSRVQLTELLGRPVRVVAYPYGDYNEAVMGLAREAGYQAATIVRRRINRDSRDLFALHRIPVKHLTSLGRFAWDLLRLRWVHAAS